MLTDHLKKLVKQTIQSLVPMKIMHGEVQGERIQVEQRLVLERSMLIIPHGMTIQSGDRLILLRDEGGQRYLVVGREA